MATTPAPTTSQAAVRATLTNALRHVRRLRFDGDPDTLARAERDLDALFDRLEPH